MLALKVQTKTFYSFVFNNNFFDYFTLVTSDSVEIKNLWGAEDFLAFEKKISEISTGVVIVSNHILLLTSFSQDKKLPIPIAHSHAIAKSLKQFYVENEKHN